jgi:hypothetical protein
VGTKGKGRDLMGGGQALASSGSFPLLLVSDRFMVSLHFSKNTITERKEMRLRPANPWNRYFV